MPNRLTAYTSPGSYSFAVPAEVSCVFATMVGGGGGANGWPGNAGGAGGICIRAPITVTPGGTLAITVGVKGLGGAWGAAPGSYEFPRGGDSTAGPVIANGGQSAWGPDYAHGFSGGGGNVNAAPGVPNGDGNLAPRTFASPTLPISGGQSGVLFWAGGCGAGVGDAGSGAPAVNNHAGGAGGTPPQIGTNSGGGGASSFFGQGGQGGSGSTQNDGFDASATHYGAGAGAGCNAGSGGDGAGGLVWIEWVEP